MKVCVETLKTDDHWPSDKESVEQVADEPQKFPMEHDVLSSSTELTLLLRLCIVHKLFMCKEASVELVGKLIDRDPYLSSLEELRQENPDDPEKPPLVSREELLMTVSQVLKRRDDWANIRTVRA